MTFYVDNNPSPSEIASAINYLLANFAQTTAINPNSGQITSSGYGVVSYLYKYLNIKYADSFDGSLNFSNSPTGRTYYGLRNNDSSIESTNPVDYVWTLVAGGFGTTKNIYYATTGGRQIQYVVATAKPSASWLPDTGAAIDLDFVTYSNFDELTALAPRAELGTMSPQNAEKVNITGGLISGLSSPLEIASGGTNTTTTPTAGAVAYGTGTAYGFTAAGTVGQYLQSTGASAPTWSSISSGVGSAGYYGLLISTINQTNGGATTANVVALDSSPVLSNGVSVVSSSRITFANAGQYHLINELAFTNSTGSNPVVSVWLAKNGTNIANTTQDLQFVGGANNVQLTVCSWTLDISAGDYIQIYWSCSATTVSLAYQGALASPTRPASPSAIANVFSLPQIGIGYYGLTSATSTTIATGSKTFTTNLSVSGTAFAVGTRVRVAYTTTPANFMEGVITAYTTTSMTVNVDLTGGSGTYAAWTISVAGNQGTGAVTSVTGTSPVSSSGGTTPAISLAAAYGDTLNPYGTKTANYVLAGPTTGVAAVPAFRALVASDVPGSALTKTDDTNVTLTLGGSPTTALINAASLTLGWTGQLGTTRGGTGLSSFTNSGIVYASSTSALATGSTLTYDGNSVINSSAGSGTNSYGFNVSSSLTGATNNYGFYGNIASGSNRYNFYAAGTATNYFGGNTIVEVTDNTNAALRVTQLGSGNALLVEDSTNPDSTPFVIDTNGKVVSGNTAAYSATTSLIPQIASVGNTNGTASMGIGRFSADVNQGYYVFTKSRSTTLGTLGSIVSSGDAIGTLLWTADDGTTAIQAASITASVDGAPGTSDMPGRLVFNTTADGASAPTERMRIDNAGAVGIGSASLTARRLVVGGNMTGATGAYGVLVAPTIQPDVTVNALVTASQASTAANGGTPYTVAALACFNAAQGTFNADSTVTNQYGFAATASLTGATNNYGFHSNIATAANRYNFYANGTAPNRFSGDVQIFGAGGLGYTTGSGGTTTQGTSRTTGVTLSKTNGAITMFTAAGSMVAATFTVTNTLVAATDTIILNQKSGTNLYVLLVTAVAAGSFNITFYTTGGVASDAPVINFSVIKAVTA